MSEAAEADHEEAGKAVGRWVMGDIVDGGSTKGGGDAVKVQVYRPPEGNSGASGGPKTTSRGLRTGDWLRGGRQE